MPSNNAAPVSVVLFDLGGVVCRFNPTPRLTTLARLAGLAEAEVQRRLFDSGLTRDFDRGRYTSTQWHALVCALLGLRLSPAEFEDIMLGVLEVNPHMIELVDTLRPHTRVAMLTDNPPLLAEAIPHRFPELVGRFDPMLFSYQLGVLKPDAEAFRLALARIGVPAQHVLFIDDTSANVEAARAIGLEAHHFTSVQALRADLTTRGLLD